MVAPDSERLLDVVVADRERLLEGGGLLRWRRRNGLSNVGARPPRPVAYNNQPNLPP